MTRATVRSGLTYDDVVKLVHGSIQQSQVPPFDGRATFIDGGFWTEDRWWNRAGRQDSREALQKHDEPGSPGS